MEFFFATLKKKSLGGWVGNFFMASSLCVVRSKTIQIENFETTEILIPAVMGVNGSSVKSTQLEAQVMDGLRNIPDDSIWSLDITNFTPHNHV